MQSVSRLATIALACAFLPPTAGAATIVANTALESSAGGQTSPLLLLAAQFTSPSVSTTITSVLLPLEQGSGNPEVALSLYSDVAGLPGASLAGLGTQVVNGNLTYTFTPGVGVAIVPSTAYWLVLSCSNCVPSGTVPGITNNWGTSTGVSVAGLPGANAATGLGVSSDGGSTWSIVQNGPTSPARAFIFQVNGDVGAEIPEPATIALSGLGLLAVLCVRRRRA